MGQYYKPISIDKMQWMYSHDYKSGEWTTGLKIMEHSWILNEFVRTVEGLLVEGGKWFGDKIVWGGDYADGEPDKLDEDGKEQTLYSLVSRRKKIKPKKTNKHYRYIINMDNWEFVDKNKIPKDKDGWRIHPLPLLTCEGNGQGGGDFYGEDPDGLVGRWARKRIMVQTTKPKNMKELIFNLKENR